MPVKRIMEKIKILIADDEERMRKLVKDFLAKEGFLTVECADGAEAVKAVSEDPSISLLIMDVMMPVLNGLEATHLIRTSGHSDSGTIPIIAVSANVFDEDISRSLASGMNAHLSKPIDPLKLRQAVLQFASRNV